MNPSPFERIGSLAVAVTTPIVIVALAVVVFLNPIWVFFEQDRTGVDRLTGYSQAQVHQVTGSILSDLVFGPPRFDATVDGQAVLDAKERQHMADVRTVFMQLGIAAAVALAVFVVLAALALIGLRRRWFWKGLFWGSSALLSGVIVVGLAFTVFFEQTFALMHSLFFAPGSWEFNSGTERLVQLFPDQFWSETTVAVSVLVLLLAIVTTILSARRLHHSAELRFAGLRP